MELELWSPFLDLQLDGLSRNQVIAIFVGWMVFWIAVTVFLIWVYAVVFASVVGFQTAVLVGIALILFSVSSNE